MYSKTTPNALKHDLWTFIFGMYEISSQGNSLIKVPTTEIKPAIHFPKISNFWHGNVEQLITVNSFNIREHVQSEKMSKYSDTKLN